MPQSKFLTLDKSQNTEKKSCVHINSLTWLRWAKFLIIPGFIGLILLLILTNILFDDRTSKTRVLRDVRLQKSQFDKSNQTCIGNSCSITCKDTTSVAIADFLTNRETYECKESLTLDIQNCEFPSSTIPKHWLNGNYTINTFRITGGNLNNIEQSAFETNAFKKMHNLEMNNVQILKLSSKAFSGLDSLQKIKIIDGLYNFSPDFLEHVRETLTTLQINQVSAMQSPASLIGNRPLTKATTVELGSNNFGDYIDENTFDSLVFVRSLNLTYCQITFIGLKSFDNISANLQSVNLRYNNLTTISGEIFLPLKRATVYILGNPWNCNSNLWQLAKYYKEFLISIFGDTVVCYMPEELRDEKLETIIHLISTTTTSTTTVTTETTECTTESETTEFTSESTTLDAQLLPSTTTEEPCGKENETDVVVVKCSSCSRNICESGSNETDGLLPLKPREVDFNIKAISPYSVEITVEKVDFEFAILWFKEASRNHLEMENNYKDYGLGCRKSLAGNFSITNLQTKTSYTFCIVREGETLVSPFNCQSYYMAGGKIYDDYWLLYDSQTTVIVSSIVGLLLSMFAGAFIMFSLIRCNPNLLKTNNSSDVMILRGNDRSSTDTVTNTASTIVSSGRSSIKRKCSTASVGSGQGYEYVVPEMLYEVIENRDMSTIRKDNFYFERCPEHSPPPLPRTRRFSSGNTPSIHFNAPHHPLPIPTDCDDYLLVNSRA